MDRRKRIVQTAVLCCLTLCIIIHNQNRKMPDKVDLQPLMLQAASAKIEVEDVPESFGIGEWMLDLEENADVQALREWLANKDCEETEEDDEYANFAIAAQISHYVNVRTQPTTESDMVGKMYKGSVAEVLEVVGEGEDTWLKIISGDVEGYIKAEYFLYGASAQEAIEQYINHYAQVNVTRLNVRSKPDVESARIGYVSSGERIRFLEDQGEWIHVQYTENQDGYVASEYVTVVEEFIHAISLEEERALLEAQAALAARAAASEATTPEDTVPTQNPYEQVTPPDAVASTNSELRAQIVAYAMQYLGNRYVHGGRSLASGTDCSGFTCYLYAVFGYSLSRTPEGQLASAGRLISYDQIQPGDIICYGKSRCTHVALYIGNNQIIHAANSRKGVVIGNALYDNILGVKNVVD